MKQYKDMSKTIRVTLDIVVDTDLTSADEIMEHLNFDFVEADEDGVELEDVPEVNNFYIV